MQSTKFFKLGWIAAAGLLGIVLAGAFQGATDKFGVVDISQVVEDSDYGKANQEQFKNLKAAREGILEFIDNYRVLTNEQAQRLRDLSLKDTQTAEEKAELDRIKADVIASSKKSMELQAKPNISPEDRTLLEEYSRRSQVMEQVAQRWYKEFTSDMQNWADKQKLASVEKARAAIQEVSKAQGYTIVFEVGIAPYGANNITADALKAMNAKK